MKKDNTYIAHTTAEELQRFINGQLLQLDRREAVEEHLQQCEICLLLFMQELEANDHQTAETDWAALENNVIAAIEAEAVKEAIGESQQPAAFTEQAEHTKQPSASTEQAEHIKQPSASTEQAEHTKQPSASTEQAAYSKPSVSNRRRRLWLSLPIVQYSIAASITLLLLATGVLSGLSQQVGDLAEHAKDNRYKESEPMVQTWSDEMVSKASRWLDGLHQYRYNK
ncbi:hypothetical protein [Paenibacillus sp. IITD108]|uniref:hypothetical protein n=1 Tax=Paenibacillus sp. IITD108 TaxID=3116649 RepID=UPI002F3E2B72